MDASLLRPVAAGTPGLRDGHLPFDPCGDGDVQSNRTTEQQGLLVAMLVALNRVRWAQSDVNQLAKRARTEPSVVPEQPYAELGHRRLVPEHRVLPEQRVPEQRVPERSVPEQRVPERGVPELSRGSSTSPSSTSSSSSSSSSSSDVTPPHMTGVRHYPLTTARQAMTTARQARAERERNTKMVGMTEPQRVRYLKSLRQAAETRERQRARAKAAAAGVAVWNLPRPGGGEPGWQRRG